MKEDMKKLNGEKTDYSKLVKYYKRKLVDYGAMKELRNFVTQNQKYIRNKVSSRIKNS